VKALDSKTILLIDDDEDDQQLFIEAISQVNKDIDCQIAPHWDEAIKKLSAFSPSLIFLDLNLPRLNGIQCLAKIKSIKEFRDIPVVIYSTSALDIDVEETKKLGAVYFMTKQNTFTEICTSLREVLLLFPKAS
jgi:CheY-like chemotaxis protein